ncbi:MAG: glutamate-5-semialdehyde dehydrogenase [Solirubrobacterales bacterium]|jgi:glutamate-5-semialdehyde dehydrogenase|nr:glutamate-5-semialdehyde dehydrogenase [Solirubrobacterales bacterium]
MAATATSVREVCERAKHASRLLAQASTAAKDAALEAIAERLGPATAEILAANAADVEAARAGDYDDAFVDKLTLTGERVAAMAAGVREVKTLPDPVGEELERRTLASGLELRKLRAPIGVVALVYEARPNVTIDAAALCLKSGNAVVLRGSSAAERSNAVLAGIVAEACAEAGLPEGSVGFVAGGGHDDMRQLATQEGLVDLIIPRGGEGLKAALKDVATVPVIYAAAGNCHVYVHADADLEMAESIAYNAKVQRPGVCNAAETLLVNAELAESFLPRALARLAAAGVELVGDERARASVAGAIEVGEASEEDWATEYLGLKMAVGVVDSLEEAVEHINTHGTAHSEAIVTGSAAAGERFAAGVDAAAVYVNASTRFTDGFEFGMGAEMGNSTQKLHARGPIGLRELTTSKYVVHGDGQTRS